MQVTDLQEWAARLSTTSQRSASERKSEADLRADLFLVLGPYAYEALEMDRAAVRQEGTGRSGRFDSMFGRCIVEYKRPNLLNSPTEREHAAGQALEYLEDATLGAEVVMLTDGRTWGLLRDRNASPEIGEQAWFTFDVPVLSNADRFAWRALTTPEAAANVLALMATVRSAPVTTAGLLGRLGPGRPEVIALVEHLAGALAARVSDSRTDILFKQWLQLAGVSYGIDSTHTGWPSDPTAVLGHRLGGILGDRAWAEAIFVLHTYVAIASKLIAAEVLALGASKHDKRPTQWMSLSPAELAARFTDLESGGLSSSLRAPDLLGGDLFGWYAAHLDADQPLVQCLREVLGAFGELAWARLVNARGVAGDLLRGFYAGVVPAAMRRALGEFFTPQWIAERILLRAVQMAGADATLPRILDPACGSGTFLVAALRRALNIAAGRADGQETAGTVLQAVQSVIGCDINPVAVLMTKVNLLLALGDRADLLPSITFAVYQSDSILLPDVVQGQLTLQAYGEYLRLPLEIGEIELPSALATPQGLRILREHIEAGVAANRDADLFAGRFRGALERSTTLNKIALDAALAGATSLYLKLSALERDGGKDRIWAAVIEQSFALSMLAPVDVVVGNPPWVNWKHLPESWQQRSQRVWTQWGMWQRKRRGGGIPLADVSALLLARSITTYCKPGGVVAFLLPQSTLLADPGSRSLRRCHLAAPEVAPADLPARATFGPLAVDDFSRLNPFAPDAANKPVALYVRAAAAPSFPIPQTVWRRAIRRSRLGAHTTLRSAYALLSQEDVKIQPLQAQDLGSPWVALSGVRGLSLDSAARSAYRWGQGFHTRGGDGLFVVRVLTPTPSGAERLVRIRAERVPGATPWYEEGHEGDVEAEYLWPLARGRDVQPFRLDESGLYVIVPHDPDDLTRVLSVEDLAQRAGHLFDYLERWTGRLAARSPYQELQPTNERPWGIQGPWAHIRRESTLAMCRYMHPLGRPPAAVAEPRFDPRLGMSTTVYPNNKSNFVKVDSAEEAWFVVGCVNAPYAQEALSRFVSTTTIGPAALHRLPIPKFEKANTLHAAVVIAAQTAASSQPGDYSELDGLVRAVLD
jgi:hypothetical protein